MTVVDVDSHWVSDWALQLPELAARVPRRTAIELEAGFMASHILADVPAAERPAPRGLLSDRQVQRIEAEAADVSHLPPGALDAAARVAFLDRVGIDHQLVLARADIGYGLEDQELGRACLRANNGWALDHVAAHRRRLLPVAAVDLRDLEWTLAELRRTRAGGARSFIFRAEPAAGRSLAHPDFDRLWAAACDLGMVPMLHYGLNPARFAPGWANTGGDAAAMLRVGNSQHHQAAQVLIAALICGGVFHRFPKLSLLLAEVGVGWLPYFAQILDELVDDKTQTHYGPWRYPLRPSDYLRGHVRASPVLRPSDDPMPVLRALGPEVCVFSSDYPHVEGPTDPIREFESVLADATPEARRRFFGDSMAEVFARTGDPL